MYNTRSHSQKKDPVNSPLCCPGEYINGREKTGAQSSVLLDKGLAHRHARQLVESQLSYNKPKNVEDVYFLQVLNRISSIVNAAVNNSAFLHSSYDNHQRLAMVIGRVLPHGISNKRSTLADPPGLKNQPCYYQDRGHAVTRVLSLSDQVDTLKNIFAEHIRVNQGFKCGFESAITEHMKNKPNGEYYTAHLLHYRDHHHRRDTNDVKGSKVSLKPRRISHIFLEKVAANLKPLAALTINNSTRHLGGKTGWGSLQSDWVYKKP